MLDAQPLWLLGMLGWAVPWKLFRCSFHSLVKIGEVNFELDNLDHKPVCIFWFLFFFPVNWNTATGLIGAINNMLKGKHEALVIILFLESVKMAFNYLN